MVSVRKSIAMSVLLASAVATAEPPRNRIGLEAAVTGGEYISAVGSVHYERGLVGHTTGIVRFESGLVAAVMDNGRSSRIPFAVTGGGRLYLRSRAYVELEVGVALTYQYAFDDGLSTPSPAEVLFTAAGRVGVGVHLGRFDIGVVASATTLGVGLRVGGDIALW